MNQTHRTNIKAIITAGDRAEVLHQGVCGGHVRVQAHHLKFIRLKYGCIIIFIINLPNFLSIVSA